MSVIAPTITKSGDGSCITVTWAAMANGDTGAPFYMSSWADRSIQVAGTFGAGGNCKFQGSNNGTTYIVLTDPQGNALDITAAKIEAVTECVAQVQPNISAGDGTTALTVTMFARRGDGLRSR